MKSKQLNNNMSARPHVRITLAFLLFGFLWIVLSDRSLNILFPEVEIAYHFQTYKGWFFVALTAILIYFITLNHFKKTLDLTNNLRERNHFIETILDNIPVGLAVHENSSGKAIYVNNKFEEIYGWPLREKDVDGFFNTVYSDPDYRSKIKEMVMRDIRSGIPERMFWDNIHITTRNGNHRVISARNIPIVELGLMVSLVTDLTENKKAERQIIESRNRYKAIFEHSPFPIWEEDYSQIGKYIERLKQKGILNIEGYLDNNLDELKRVGSLIRTVDLNQEVVRLFRAPDKKQLLERNIYEGSTESAHALKIVTSALFRGENRIEFFLTSEDFTGGILYLKLRIAVTPGHEEDLKHILVSVIDITDITLSQRKLIEERQKANIAIESSGLGYWEADYTKNINLINEQWANMLEYEKNDINESFSHFLELIHPEDRGIMAEAMHQPENHIRREVRMKTKSGKWKWISINGIILERDENGKAIRTTGTHRDLSFERDKEKELLRSFIEGKDRERKRVARELHDSLGQALSAASMSFEFVRNEQENLSQEAREHILTGLLQLNEAIEETRNISHDLLPRTVEDFGLIPGIRNLVSNIHKTYKLEVFFYENIKDIVIDQEKELHIYRIVQEALNNAIKHSGCSKINLQLILHNTTLAITIEDNGNGFDKESIDKLNPGFGFRNIEIRCKVMSADFNLETSPGKGTTLVIELEIP